MTGVLIMLVVLLALVIGGIFLQIFLSKQPNKWLGRVLPILTFSFSVLTVLMYLLSFMAGTPIWQVSVTLAMAFVLHNIPTIILCVIYKACREKINRNSQIDKNEYSRFGVMGRYRTFCDFLQKSPCNLM